VARFEDEARRLFCLGICTRGGVNVYALARRGWRGGMAIRKSPIMGMTTRGGQAWWRAWRQAGRRDELARKAAVSLLEYDAGAGGWRARVCNVRENHIAQHIFTLRRWRAHGREWAERRDIITAAA
jgi:hypothetical protein